MWQAVFDRDNWEGFYCGQQVFNIARGCKKAVTDQLIPFLKGGKDEFWNYVTACFICNIQKKDRTVDEFKAVFKQHLLGKISLIYAARNDVTIQLPIVL